MRLVKVVIVSTLVAVSFAVRATGALCCSGRLLLPSIFGKCIADFCERLGGAYLKAGQILSTRVDLLPEGTASALARLRDQATPIPFSSLANAISPLADAGQGFPKIELSSTPLASATIAQVHIGTIAGVSQLVAVKVRRPGIERLLKSDIRHIRVVTRLVARLPWFRRFPIAEATEEVVSAMLWQSDFVRETQMLQRFGRLFQDNQNIKIPKVFHERSTDDLIVMEFLDGYRPIPTFRQDTDSARLAVQTGLRALYKMIFNAGLIHCDLHASNILCNQNGRVALLDFGFVAEMTPQAKQSFSEFFLAIAFRDGKTAARIVRETALRIGPKCNELEFERDMQTLVDKTGGRKAADFQVAGFVFELFQVQRRHGIYGSPDFTLPILSLLTYEGLIKDIYPDIDFQQEAVPFIMAALAHNA